MFMRSLFTSGFPKRVRHSCWSMIFAAVIFFSCNATAKTCLGDGGTWIWGDKDVPTGLGIKRLVLQHLRDENSEFQISFKKGSVNEISGNIILENRDTPVYQPKNPVFKSGDQPIKYGIMGNWLWGYPTRHMEFPCIEFTHYADRDVHTFWTGRDEPANTVIIVEFGN